MREPFQPLRGETTGFRQIACARSAQNVVNLRLQRAVIGFRRCLQLLQDVIVEVADQQVRHGTVLANAGIIMIPARAVVCHRVEEQDGTVSRILGQWPSKQTQSGRSDWNNREIHIIAAADRIMERIDWWFGCQTDKMVA
jgi:hypothetical protein